MLYELEGIPNEYYKCCYSLDKDHTDTQSLKNKIEEIMEIPFEERKQKALTARKFVLENKNPVEAGKAILSLLHSTV